MIEGDSKWRIQQKIEESEKSEKSEDRREREGKQEIEERQRENDELRESLLTFGDTCKRYKEERDILIVNMQELNDEIIQSKQIWDNEKFEMQKKV